MNVRSILVSAAKVFLVVSFFIVSTGVTAALSWRMGRMSPGQCVASGRYLFSVADRFLLQEEYDACFLALDESVDVSRRCIARLETCLEIRNEDGGASWPP